LKIENYYNFEDKIQHLIILVVRNLKMAYTTKATTATFTPIISMLYDPTRPYIIERNVSSLLLNDMGQMYRYTFYDQINVLRFL